MSAAPPSSSASSSCASSSSSTLLLRECLTVPPQPDVSFLPESVLVQRDLGHAVTVRPGVTVRHADVLAEHGGAAGAATAGVAPAFDRYRCQLLW
eukprot:SAG22_NODE_10656_length_522_cov_1.342790_1_plen_94_part_10